MKSSFKRNIFLWLLIAVFFGLIAFSRNNDARKSLFQDNFEGYFSSDKIKRAYAYWQDGARLDISVDTVRFESGRQSMRIDVLGPNPYNDANNGSIYRSISLGDRNWSGATGISFWVFNPANVPLRLTFNFKEAYNEYWSLEHGNPFLLQSSPGVTVQNVSQNGNLIIPAGFSGKIIIPISSFAVPDWNTARGDQQLQLSNIESYALGITLNNDYPRTFYIDSFIVLPADEPTITIHGVKQIRIPESGEYRVAYKIENGLAEDFIQGNWKVKSKTNPLLSIDQEGVLSIPAGTRDETISIISERPSAGGSREVSMDVILLSESSGISKEHVAGTEEIGTEEIKQESDYDRFAANFELWAMENRPLFVLLSVGFVVFIIFLLSVFQNRLK